MSRLLPVFARAPILSLFHQALRISYETQNLDMARAEHETQANALSHSHSCVSGNSYLESPGGEIEGDELLQMSRYQRSRQQQMEVGLLTPEDQDEEVRDPRLPT